MAPELELVQVLDQDGLSRDFVRDMHRLQDDEWTAAQEEE